MNVLHIVSHLNYSGSNKEMAALAVDQRRNGSSRVCCLGVRGPWAGRLEAAGVAVDVLGWSRCIDVTAPWRLREELCNPKIDAVHVWGAAALRWTALVAPSKVSRLIFSPPFARHWHPLDRWLLGRVRTVVVRDDAERTQALGLGATSESLVVAPPGVVAMPVSLTKEKRGTRVVGIGPIEARKNFRDAIWSMDILANVFDDIDLELVGQGSHRQNLGEFAVNFQKTKLRLAGEPDDVAPHFAAADVCWLTGKSGCRHVALEAMAAGRAVVASNLPHLRGLIPDGEAGFLVPPGEKIELARKTRSLLLDPNLRQRMGENGRAHVQRHFPHEAFLQRWRDVYAIRAA